MKKFLPLAAKGFILLLVLCGLLFTASVWIVNSSLSYLLFKNDIDNICIQAERITPWTTVIQSFLGAPEHPTIALPRIEIKYSPGQIAQGRIDSAVIDGAVILTVLEDGKLRLKNFQALSSGGKSGASSLVPILPVGIDSLQLNNCRLVLSGQELPTLDIIISGQLQFHYRDNQKTRFELESLTADFQTEGAIHSVLHASLKFGEEDTIFAAHTEFQELADFASLFPGKRIIITGKGIADTEFTLPKDMGSIKRLKATLMLSEALVDNGALKLVSPKPSPLLFAAEGTTAELDYELSNVRIEKDITASAALKGKIYPAAKKVTGNGHLTSDIFEVPVRIGFEGSMQARLAELSLQLSGDSQRLQEKNSFIDTGYYRIQTHLVRTPAGVTAENHLQISSVSSPKHKLRLNTVTGDFTFNPAAGDSISPGTGRAAVKEIHFKGENLAGLTAQISQRSNSNIEFAAILSSHLENPVQLHLNGDYSLADQFTLRYQLDPTRIDNSSLPNFIELPEGLHITGDLQADGTFLTGGPTPGGNLNIHLSNANLNMEEKEFSLSGISTDITFPHLPRLQSSPSQKLTVEEIQFGSIRLDGGRVTYRLEDSSTLFVEKSRFNWCGGRIEGGSLRVKPDSPEFSTTFYCDRLQFSELLSQFSITGTEGDGSLNGRLPISLSKGGLTFDDGFLFSTPGNSGIVQFTNTDMLRDSMPDMGQAAYLDYSLQALDNFSYNWTKLTFNSQGEELLISMQIDGKPATPLPFGYKNGHLVSSPKGAGIQHPVRLDVNFHLPLAEMFKYGQNLQKIMENM